MEIAIAAVAVLVIVFLGTLHERYLERRLRRMFRDDDEPYDREDRYWDDDD